jgi:hypothetical protein
MALLIRLVTAILAGGVVAILLAYAGLVVMMLVIIGMPLGAEPQEPSRGQYALLLAIAVLGAAAGGRLTARIARSDASLAALALAGLLAAMYWWGFSRPGSSWPEWWAPSVAAATAVGVWLGVLSRRARYDSRQSRA